MNNNKMDKLVSAILNLGVLIMFLFLSLIIETVHMTDALWKCLAILFISPTVVLIVIYAVNRFRKKRFRQLH